MWDERFASASDDWRAVIPKVVDQFLACGLLNPEASILPQRRLHRLLELLSGKRLR